MHSNIVLRGNGKLVTDMTHSKFRGVAWENMNGLSEPGDTAVPVPEPAPAPAPPAPPAPTPAPAPVNGPPANEVGGGAAAEATPFSWLYV